MRLILIEVLKQLHFLVTSYSNCQIILKHCLFWINIFIGNMVISCLSSYQINMLAFVHVTVEFLLNANVFQKLFYWADIFGNFMENWDPSIERET